MQKNSSAQARNAVVQPCAELLRTCAECLRTVSSFLWPSLSPSQASQRGLRTLAALLETVGLNMYNNKKVAVAKNVLKNVILSSYNVQHFSPCVHHFNICHRVISVSTALLRVPGCCATWWLLELATSADKHGQTISTYCHKKNAQDTHIHHYTNIIQYH